MVDIFVKDTPCSDSRFKVYRTLHVVTHTKRLVEIVCVIRVCDGHVRFQHESQAILWFLVTEVCFPWQIHVQINLIICAAQRTTARHIWQNISLGHMCGAANHSASHLTKYLTWSYVRRSGSQTLASNSNLDYKPLCDFWSRRFIFLASQHLIPLAGDLRLWCLRQNSMRFVVTKGYFPVTTNLFLQLRHVHDDARRYCSHSRDLSCVSFSEHPANPSSPSGTTHNSSATSRRRNFVCALRKIWNQRSWCDAS